MNAKVFRLVCIGLVAGCGCFAQTLFKGQAPAKAPTPLKMATVAPQRTSVHLALEGMGQQWKKSGVALTIFTGGSMSGEADIVRRMELGQLQAALLSGVGLGEIEPAVTALQLMPMAFRSLDEVGYVREQLKPMLEKRLRAKGYVPLFWGDVGWIRFFSKTELVSVAEVKRRKMFAWAGDTAQIEIQKAAGYRPVPLEVGDIMLGLQTGQIEVVAQPPFFALAGQLDKFAPHMTAVNWAPMVGAAVITKDAWDSLSPAARDSMLKAAQETGDQITATGRKESDDSVTAMRARNLKVHELTPAQTQEWRIAAEALYPKFRGHTVPSDVFDEVLRLLAQYRSGK